MKKKLDNKNFIGEKEIKKYKDFAFKEDMVKMSVAFILGASFNKVVSGISDFLVMPFINFMLIKTGDSWRKLSIEPVRGLRIEIGQFLGVMVDFLLISFVLYIIYGKIITKIIKDNKTEMKKCHFCMSNINALAVKCPECTGDLINVQSRRIRK